jgi:hypothetical protein
MPFPTDEKYVEATEEKLGVRFPESFRKKMIAENGGEVETPPDAWILYPFYDTSDRKRIARTCNDIVRETESARGWTGFPPDAVAIGSNGGGDQLIMLRSFSNPEVLDQRVFWWDHETGDVHPVANDFSELSAP